VVQCEAYAAAKLNLRLGPALAGGNVAGDPLFAFPDTVDKVVDGDDRVMVQTSHSCHLIAADGRPLAVSIRSDDVISESAGDADNRFVALYLASETDGVVSLRRWSDGTERWRYPIDSSRLLAVSADGQAVLALQGEKLRVLIGGKSRVMPGRWATGGAMVAPQGRWLIARRYRDSDQVERIFVRGEIVASVRSFVEGPDGTAVLIMAPAQARLLGVVGTVGESDDESLVVRLDAQGNASLIPMPMSLGRAPMVTEGGGLVLLGSDARTPGVTAVDLLGEAVTTGAQEPKVTAFRWADVLAAKDGEAPQPCLVMNGRIRRCSHQVAAWFVWSGRQVALLRPARAEDGRIGVQTQAWPEQDREIQHITGRHGRVLVQLDNGGQRVCDEQGTVLAESSGQISIETSAWGLATAGQDGQSPTWTLFGFRTPGKRIELSTTTGCQQLDVDALERFFLGRKAGEALYFGLPSGVRVEVPPWTQLYSERDFFGRFLGLEGRIRAKTDAWDGGRGQWVIADSMPLGSAGPMVVLDRAGQVWVPAARRDVDPWQKIGSDLRYAELVKAERGLVLTPNTMAIIGRIDPRQTPLAVQPAPGMVQAEDPDWQTQPRQSARTWSFRSAGGQRLAWLPGRAGFMPRRLHMTAQGGLVVVTPSLVLGVPANALSLVAGADRMTR
jgi:hypothetical protein